MANGRNKGKTVDSGRDSGGFIALPWSVIDSPAYGRLSVHARALLLEVARQFVRDNNGRLLLSRAYMEKRGWKSTDMLTKCKRELLEGGFIFETVMGHRPNKASWYAVTWRDLNKLPGYDQGALGSFQRGAYRLGGPIADSKAIAKPIRAELHALHLDAGLENASLRPPHGTDKPSIAPPHGTALSPPVPPDGPIRTPFACLPVPPHGHHLDLPSDAVGCPVSESAMRCCSQFITEDHHAHDQRRNPGQRFTAHGRLVRDTWRPAAMH